MLPFVSAILNCPKLCALKRPADEVDNAVKKAAQKACSGLLLCDAKVQEEKLGPLLKRALPITEDGLLEPTFLRDLMRFQKDLLRVKLLKGRAESKQRRMALAIAQASGSGKTKAALSVGMFSDASKPLVPIFVQFSTNTVNCDPTVMAVAEIIEQIFNDAAPIGSSYETVLAAHSFAIRLFHVFVLCFVLRAVRLVEAIASLSSANPTPLIADNKIEALIRAQYVVDGCVLKHLVFEHAKEAANQTLLQRFHERVVQTGLTAFSKWTQSPSALFYYVYDEVGY